jgi:hypothetical protein
LHGIFQKNSSVLTLQEALLVYAYPLWVVMRMMDPSISESVSRRESILNGNNTTLSPRSPSEAAYAFFLVNSCQDTWI